MGLTPQQKMRNYREKLRDDPERYEKIKLRDRERKKKTRLSWSKQKKKLENKKNLERTRKYRLTLSFAKELKNEANNSFVQNKTPEEILHHLQKEKGVFDQTSKAFSSTPLRNPLLPTDVKTPHTLRKMKGPFNSASKAITSTPARTPKYTCSIKKNKAKNSTPARTPFSASKAGKFTPARTPFSASKAVKFTPARTPLSALKDIKSTPIRTPKSASKAIKSTPVRTPFSSLKKKTLDKNNKRTPLLVSENISRKRTLEEKIEQFYVKHTWLCRRDKRLKIKPRVLMIPLKNLHKAFCDENPDLRVSINKFSSLKPPKLQVVKKVDFSAFLSIYGGSSKMIISEILKVCVDLPEQFRNLMCLNICDQNNKACKSGACKKCPFHEKISSTDEMEDKINLRDDKSTISGTQSKMNIIEKFVIGAFTPPPDLKPLQFHEVSKVLQTRLQENKKNIHIVKIIQGANKSPKLQIQVEKKIKRLSEAFKENQAQEIEVSKIENKGGKLVSKTVIDTNSNNDAVKGSKKGKTESPNDSSLKNSSKKSTSLRDENTEKQLLNPRKGRKSIENENCNSIPSSLKKGPKNAKKDEGKTKINKKVKSPKKKNPSAKKTEKASAHIQASTDEKTKKGMKKQVINNKDDPKDEANTNIKSTEKENEEKDTKLTKKAIRSRSGTNAKSEKILKCRQTEDLKNDSSRLQVIGNGIDKNEGDIICHSSENSKGDKHFKNSQNQRDNDKIDVDSTSEVSSTPNQSFHEYDESFTLGRKKGKSKPKPRKPPLNPIVSKHTERRQSKITTFLSAENSQNNKSVKNVSKKSEAEILLQKKVESTIEKVIEKCKQDEKGVSSNKDIQSSEQKREGNVNESKKNVDKDRLKKLKKVRRSIVTALNESALDELDTDVMDEGPGKNEVSGRKRKSLISSPKCTNEDLSKAPVNKKRKTETQILDSDKVQNETKPKNVAKNKKSDSKKKPNVNDQTELPKNDKKNAIEAKTAKSEKENKTNNGKTKKVAVEKIKKSNKVEQKNYQENIKPDQNNVAASEELLADSNIEKSSKEKDLGNIDINKKILNNEKLKKMKKVRRSIVVQLNESALSEADIDLAEEVNKENEVDDKKRELTEIKPKNKVKPEVLIEKKKGKKTNQLDDKKPKKNAKVKDDPKTKRVVKPKETKSKKKPVIKEITKSPEINNRAAAEAKARELLMPEDCPITANRGTMKYLEQRSTLFKAIDNQKESDGDIFSSNIFKRRSGVSNLLESDNINDTFAIRTPNCKGAIENPDGTSPFTPRTGMFANWADLSVSTHKTPTVKALPTPTVDTEHKKVVMQVTYHMQKNKRRGIRKLQTTDESDGKVGPKSRKKNKSLMDLPNMPEDEIDDLGDDYFF